MTKKQSEESKPKKDEKLQEQIELLQTQVVELTEALQRERADATNLRRRHDEQMASLKTTVKAHVIHDLLPVIDNFERSLKHAPAAVNQTKDADNTAQHTESRQYDDFVKGVQGIVKQFEKTLTDLGVERVATVGAVFDPRLHEAVSMEDGDGTTEVVSEELQAGYRLDDEVIRHAMVRVKMA